MNKLLDIRGDIIDFYKRFESIILIIGKFIFGFLVFQILGGIDAAHPKLATVFGEGRFIIHLFLAVIFTIIPPTLANLLVIVYLTIQVSSSLAFAGLIFLMGLVILLLYGRMAPKELFLVIGIFLGFYLKIPYAVAIFAGLYVGIGGIIPITIGTFIWYVAPKMKEVISNIDMIVAEDPDGIMAVPLQMLAVFKVFFTTLLGDYKWIFIAFVFLVMIITILTISKMTMNYAKEIAVVTGGVFGLIGMCVATLMMDIPLSVMGIVLSSFFSMALMLGISFFDMVLDYEQVEKLQFQDEHFYYHVQVIPKIGDKRPEIKVRERREKKPSRRNENHMRTRDNKKPTVPADFEETRRLDD